MRVSRAAMFVHVRVACVRRTICMYMHFPEGQVSSSITRSVLPAHARQAMRERVGGHDDNGGIVRYELTICAQQAIIP